MLIIPAIDLKGGKVVRLTRGDFSQQTTYSEDPADVALTFQQQGAQRIHVVDLEGALLGESKNLSALREIVNEVSVPIEFGGGIRGLKDIEKILKIGVSYAVIGTQALKDLNFLQEAIKKFKEKIAVCLDAKGVMLMAEGWGQESGRTIEQSVIKQFEEMGLQSLIYTDISRDGTLEGPNFEGIKNIINLTKIPVIASGGVASLEDVKELKQIKGLFGTIIGKAIYENKINLKEAIEIAKSPHASACGMESPDSTGGSL